MKPTGISARENLRRVISHDHPVWVPNGMESVVTIGPPVVERPGEAGPDAFGVDWSLESDAEGGTFPRHGGHTVTDLGQWRAQVSFPDLGAIDWSDTVARVAEINRDECMVSGFVEMGLFERSYLLLGMEEALVSYLTRPDEIVDLLNAIADYKIDLIGRFDNAIGLDMVWYGDDWGTQDALFIPPDVWRATIGPGTQRIYDCMKERHILINQHSCGRIEAVFADVVRMGADVWNPCQPCNDLRSLKQLHGDRVTFCGGIDSQFVLGKPGVTPDEVRAEVRRRIDDLAGGGGYIAAPSHTVPYRQDLLDAMNDEIATYGRIVYQDS